MTSTTIEAADSRPVLLRRERLGHWLGRVLLAVLVGWLLWNVVIDPVRFADLTLAGLRTGSLFALIALGYTLVYGIIGLINFAHGDLFMLSSVMASVLLVNRLGADTASARSWLLAVPVLLLVMAFGAGVNAAADRLAFRRLRDAPRLAALIVAVGLSFVFQWFGLLLNGSGEHVFTSIIPSGGVALGPVVLDWSTLVVTAVTVPLLLALSRLVNGTRRGRAMRATAQDRDVATLMGVNVNSTIAFTFAVGGALAGAAGVLHFATFGDTNYNLGFEYGLVAFTAAVLGGVGNLPGAVLGGYLIGLAQAYNDGLPLGLGQQWSQSVVFGLLILLMVFKPEGILGTRAVEKV
jgi:branched-chain amino acid transport system permease protein